LINIIEKEIEVESFNKMKEIIERDYPGWDILTVIDIG